MTSAIRLPCFTTSARASRGDDAQVVPRAVRRHRPVWLVRWWWSVASAWQTRAMNRPQPLVSGGGLRCDMRTSPQRSDQRRTSHRVGHRGAELAPPWQRLNGPLNLQNRRRLWAAGPAKFLGACWGRLPPQRTPRSRAAGQRAGFARRRRRTPCSFACPRVAPCARGHPVSTTWRGSRAASRGSPVLRLTLGRVSAHRMRPVGA